VATFREIGSLISKTILGEIDRKGRLTNLVLDSDTQIGGATPGNLKLTGNLSIKVNFQSITSAGVTNINVDDNSTILAISNSTTNNLTVTLPSNPVDGQIIIVCDYGGTAASQTITLVPKLGVLIDTSTTKVISTNSGYQGVLWAKNKWITFIATGGGAGGGVNAFTTTTADFVQPAAGANVSVSVLNTTWMAAGQSMYITTAGYYTVASITNGTTVVLTNTGYAGNAAPTVNIAQPQQVSPAGTIGPAGIITGASYYPHAIASDIAPYEILDRTPPTEGQVDESASCVGAGANTFGTPVLIDEYVTNYGDPLVSIIPVGEWEFHFWAYASAINQVERLVYEVYKRAAGGAETLLFSLNSSAILSTSNLAPTELLDQYIQISDILLTTTDRVAIKIYAQTSSNSAKTIHFLHSGTTYAAHVHTTISQGLSGANAFTITTAGFTVPSIGNNVTITVGQTNWMVTGQTIYIESAGYYTVTSVTDLVHVSVNNTGDIGNAAPTTVIATAKKVSPGGVQGGTGASGGAGPQGIAGNPGLISAAATSTNLSGFQAVAGFIFDDSLYPGKTFKFQALLQCSNAARIAYARLWNVTDNASIVIVDNSASGDHTQPYSSLSGALTMPGALKTYEVQIHIDVQATDVAICKRAEILII
jgi:hypothetical protein